MGISDLTVTAFSLKIFKIKQHFILPVPLCFSPFSSDSLLSCRRIVISDFDRNDPENHF